MNYDTLRKTVEMTYPNYVLVATFERNTPLGNCLQCELIARNPLSTETPKTVLINLATGKVLENDLV